MKTTWLEISKNQYGGTRYNHEAQIALKSAGYEVENVFCGAQHLSAIRVLRIPEALWNLCRLKGKSDMWVRDFYSTLTMPLDRTKGRNMVVLHHVDFSGFSFLEGIILSLFEKLVFYRNLKKADVIVTISEYWRQYFVKRGYKNVYKIYPGVDVSDFNITKEEVGDFKKRYNLEGKPIIYLGNCQKAKGVVESYDVLQNFNAHLVTSGRQQVNIPVKNLDLSYRDYLILLKASSVVLAMSKFKEGWCITAQEAMLSKTPVIGSGTGGMRELLEGGEQIVSKGFKNLKKEVEYILENKKESEKIGERGYNFAKEFTLERFHSEWVKLIEKI